MSGPRSRKISVVSSPSLDIQAFQLKKLASTENERSYINQYKDNDTKIQIHI